MPHSICRLIYSFKILATKKFNDEDEDDDDVDDDNNGDDEN